MSISDQNNIIYDEKTSTSGKVNKTRYALRFNILATNKA